MARLLAVFCAVLLGSLAGIGLATVTTTPAANPAVAASVITGTVSPANGGTGVANNAAATLTRSGNHALTITTTGTTGVTLPTSGTVCASGNACAASTVTATSGTGADGYYGSLKNLGYATYPTMSNGDGTAYGDSTWGLLMGGKGSSKDWGLFNNGGNPVLSNPTGTQLVVLHGTSSPASGAACTAGTLTWDASYIYVCTASGAWKRAALTGGY